MSDKQKLVALTLVQRWWGISPEVVRTLAEQDGIALRPSSWGAAVGRRDLRCALSRRGIPIPPGLEEWPRVLVAADEIETLKRIFDALDDAYPDAGVHLAHDGGHAARELESFKPHLLIADFGAPRFDADDVCRRSRFSPAFPVTKVIALGAEGEERERAVNHGAELLGRRFTPEDLAAAAARLLSDEPADPPVHPRPRGLARLFAWG